MARSKYEGVLSDAELTLAEFVKAGKLDLDALVLEVVRLRQRVRELEGERLVT